MFFEFPTEVQIVEDWANTLWDELDYKKDSPARQNGVLNKTGVQGRPTSVYSHKTFNYIIFFPA